MKQTRLMGWIESADADAVWLDTQLVACRCEGLADPAPRTDEDRPRSLLALLNRQFHRAIADRRTA